MKKKLFIFPMILCLFACSLSSIEDKVSGLWIGDRKNNNPLAGNRNISIQQGSAILLDLQNNHAGVIKNFNINEEFKFNWEIKDSILYIGNYQYPIKKITSDSIILICKEDAEIFEYGFQRIKDTPINLTTQDIKGLLYGKVWSLHPDKLTEDFKPDFNDYIRFISDDQLERKYWVALPEFRKILGDTALWGINQYKNYFFIGEKRVPIYKSKPFESIYQLININDNTLELFMPQSCPKNFIFKNSKHKN